MVDFDLCDPSMEEVYPGYVKTLTMIIIILSYGPIYLMIILFFSSLMIILRSYLMVI
jgi:hypothetical protein